MRALDRKLLRDLWQLKGQAVAISLVIACGVAAFVLSLSALRSLELTKATYYDRYRFAHVFAHLKRAPDALAARLAEIPGVTSVEKRIIVPVNLDIVGLAEPAVGRFISLPDTHEPALNRLHLRRGRMLRPFRDDEVLASEAFAEANRLQVGDAISAVINGRRKSLHIVGIALSPEYIFEIQEGDLLPDNRHFGVFWMGEEALSIGYDLEGAFNDVSLGLMRGAAVDEVIHRVDRLIKPYGGLGSYGRVDQTSNLLIENEMDGLRSMALIVPIIFLGVAAFLLNVVLSRIIGTQREQIAALKAFGYTHGEVGWHYGKLVLAIATVGVGLGSVWGSYLGEGLTRMYAKFYHFPVFTFHLGWNLLPVAWGISGAAALVGTAGAIRRAMRLPPAEAMRPEPPANYRRTLAERLGLGRFISPVGRMVLRQIERHPLKTGLTCLAVGLATGILVLGSFMQDSLNYMMQAEFYMSRRFDMSVSTVEPVDESMLHELAHLPGVLHVEPVRSVPVRIRGGHRHRRVGLTGIRSEGTLHKLVDVDMKVRPLPQDGLFVSATLAKLLAVKVGDEVTVEVLERERPTLRVPIVGDVRDFAGTLAYMNLTALQRLMREGPLITGAYLDVDPKFRAQLYTQLKRTPKVAGVSIKEAGLESFRNTIAENLLRMRLINVIFAITIAVGVVYNAARISLAERSRELATLRVIGFTRGEISAILLGELGVVTLAAIPLGLVIGHFMCALTALTVNEELFRIPIVVSRWTYAFASSVILVATVLSALAVRRRLDHLDLIGVLKSRE